jgi:glutathione S-transferase
MSKPKLTYFDFPGGRGEDCRIAFFVAGVDFEDDRVSGPAWKELKPESPFGKLPILREEGKPALGQSNAILAYIGRCHGLHPADPWEAARHEAVMAAVEELRVTIIEPTMKIEDDAEKRRVREELSADAIPAWGGQIERQIEGPFIGGDELNVADIKLFTAMNWLARGVVDHVAPDVFKNCQRMGALFDAVKGHPRVAEWRGRFA